MDTTRAPPADMSRIASQFGAGTAAGRLLRQLYGKPEYHAAPSFRALATRPLAGPQPRMRDLGAPATRARDPTAATFDRAAPLDVPSVLPAAPAPLAAIEALGPQRRSASSIRARSEAEARAGDIALPPLRRGRNAEAEKQRLQLINQFKGGLGGGQVALAATDGPIPLALLTGPGRAQARPASRAAGSGRGASPEPDSQLLQALRGTYAAVATGMEEAHKFMEELRGLGAATTQAEARHAAEVLGQGRELARLQAAINSEVSRRRPVTVEGGRGLGGGGGGGSPAAAAPAGSPPRAPPRAFGEGDIVGGGFRITSPSKAAGAAGEGGGLGVVGVASLLRQ